MDAIDRRDVLRALLCGAVAAGLGASLLLGSAEAMPLAMQKDPGKKAGNFTHEARGYPAAASAHSPSPAPSSSSAAAPLGLLVAPRTSPLWMALAVTTTRPAVVTREVRRMT